jgi:Kef-type K+ transport system membrane component KefB
MGRSMVVVGVGQFVIDVLLGVGVFALLGYRMSGGAFDLLYLAVVTALSSTLIVVKLLRDKFQLKTVSGRLTLGVLIVQDLWAILFMALQPNLNDPGFWRIAQSAAAGLLLVGLAFLVSRYLLCALFEASARRPELVLLTSVAWCFAVSGVAERLGLSREMGALIAGTSIAAFPYGSDVISKVAGVRDFFVTLFFVALGLKVPVPTAGILGQAGVIVLFVFLSRFAAVVPCAYLLGEGLGAGIVSALNLSQISEFALVILTLGAGYGHVGAPIAALVLTTMILTSLLSSYVIQYNDRIARTLMGLLRHVGLRDSPEAGAQAPEAGESPDIVLLGHYRIAQAVLDVVEQRAPRLRESITVVDYNAPLGRQVAARGFRWAYGDLANPDSLEHLGIERARIIVCTISDTWLKGISTRRLLLNLKRLAPDARIVMTGEERTDREDLSKDGADHVLIPGEITGERIFELLTDGRP